MTYIETIRQALENAFMKLEAHGENAWAKDCDTALDALSSVEEMTLPKLPDECVGLYITKNKNGFACDLYFYDDLIISAEGQTPHAAVLAAIEKIEP